MLKHLTNIKYATPIQKQKELWDVEGVLKKRFNRSYKFDLRPLKNHAKNGSFKTKADKIVFNFKDQYIIIDVEKLHDYIKQNKLKDIQLEELISKLDWNIILPKEK